MGCGTLGVLSSPPCFTTCHDETISEVGDLLKVLADRGDCP
jgi:hypothetical protein